MNAKDAHVTKILAELGLVDSPELTPEQERMLELALDPEKQFQADIEKIFNVTLEN